MGAIFSDDLNASATGRSVTAQMPQSDVVPAGTPGVTPNSFLNVTPERLAWMVTRAVRRIEECRTEMGIDLGNPIARAGSWAWDRQNARMQYSNNMEWRRLIGQIFEINNWSLNVPRRFIRQLTANICSDLLGTDPFLAVMPDKEWPNPQAAKLAKQVEAKIQDEISQSNVREVLAESVRVALTEGERCIKVTNSPDATMFIGPAVIAIAPAGWDGQQPGQPMKTPITQEYIFPKDETFPDPFVQGNVRFVKDPAMSMTPQQADTLPSLFQPVQNLEQKLVHRKGLYAQGLFCEDFLYPIMAPFETADIMVHCYDEFLDTIGPMYDDYEFATAFKANFIQYSAALSATGFLSGASQPILDMGELVRPQDSVRRVINIHETYLRCRVNPEDKHESWVYLVLDITSRQPIYAEYLGNMRMKRPPFVLLRGLESEPGRSYGVGIYKAWQDKNLGVDLFYNRLALKDSKEGSATFVHQDGTIETKNGQELIVGNKGVYHIPSGSEFGQEKPPLFRVNLNETSDFAMPLLELLMKTGQQEFGLADIAPPTNAAESDSLKTATGVRNLERTGNSLQGQIEDLMTEDMEKILELVTDCVLENMPAEEMRYNQETGELANLNRDEIRMLPREVRLLMSQARSAESVEMNTQAKNMVLEYYQLPKVRQKDVRDFYVSILKTLDVQDADDKLREPTDEEIAAEAQQQQMGGAGVGKEALSIAYKDAPDDVRRQMEERAGFQPSQLPPEEPAQQHPALKALPQPA